MLTEILFGELAAQLGTFVEFVNGFSKAETVLHALNDFPKVILSLAEVLDPW